MNQLAKKAQKILNRERSAQLDGMFKPNVNLNNDAAAQIAAIIQDSINKQAEVMALCLAEQANSTERLVNALESVLSQIQSLADKTPEVTVEGATVNMPERRGYSIEVEGPNGTISGTVTPERDH